MITLSTGVMTQHITAAPNNLNKETGEALAIFMNAAQMAGHKNIPKELGCLYKKINPSCKTLSKEEIAAAVGAFSPEQQAGMILDSRDQIMEAVFSGCLVYNRECLPVLVDGMSNEFFNTIVAKQRPVAHYAGVIVSIFRNNNNAALFPEIDKVARFLTLLEEFLDKNDSKPLYFYFTEWMKLMEDKDGKPLPGLEKFHNFLDQNKKQRKMLDLIKNFDKSFKTELQNPYDWMLEMAIKILNTDPKMPFAEYADKALEIMVDKEGNVKEGLQEVYTFVKENRETKTIKKLVQELPRLQAKLQKDAPPEAQKFKGQLLNLKDHFLKKYPVETLPTDVLKPRIKGNILFLKKNPNAK